MEPRVTENKMRTIPYTLNGTAVTISIDSDNTVRISTGTRPGTGTTLTTAQWSDADGCHDAYGASLTARTWDAIDAAIRGAR
jgi:hypothetical protein